MHAGATTLDSPTSPARVRLVWRLLCVKHRETPDHHNLSNHLVNGNLVNFIPVRIEILFVRQCTRVEQPHASNYTHALARSYRQSLCLGGRSHRRHTVVVLCMYSDFNKSCNFRDSEPRAIPKSACAVVTCIRPNG